MTHRRKLRRGMPVAVYYGEEPSRTPAGRPNPFWRSTEVVTPHLILIYWPRPPPSRWHAYVRGSTASKASGRVISGPTARHVANALRLHAGLEVVFHTDKAWETPVRYYSIPNDPWPARLRPRRALAAVVGEELDPDPDKVIP